MPKERSLEDQKYLAKGLLG